jgi:hypothetical protein
MKRLLVIAMLVVALVLVVPALADIGSYAEWRGRGPITVTVSGVSSFPAADQALIRAAMADWSASPSVEMVEGSGDVSIQVASNCQYACSAADKNRWLNAVAIYVNPIVLTWAERQWVYCHELGHALGLSEGYPVEQTGDYGSCMAGDGGRPSQMDFDVLAQMYPVRGTKGG